MIGPLLCNRPADDAAIRELNQRLDAFYQKGVDYPAFHGVAGHPLEWATMMPIIDGLLSRKGRITVLELGAGRSGFSQFLGPLRERVTYHVQDVTGANAEYLRGVADAVHLRPVDAMSGDYDLIWSAYVFEHVVTPRSFLENVARLVTRGGWHLMFCPHYDNPVYVCPSLRRRSVLSRTAAALQLCAGQALSLIDRRPRFYINTDPALFHGPWYRDADAVHVVTRQAVELWHAQNGFRGMRLSPPAFSFREWLMVKFMMLANAFQKA